MADMRRSGMEEPLAPPARPLWPRIRTGAGVTAVALLALFFVQNLQEVDVHFLWFDWSIRMTFALLASALAGAIAWAGFGAVRARGHHRER